MYLWILLSLLGEGVDIRNVGFGIVWFGLLDGSSFEMKATNRRRREKESVVKACGSVEKV